VWNGVPMRIRQVLVAVGAVIVASPLFATGAMAASAQLALSPDRGPQGTQVAVSGSGFCSSCGPVEIFVMGNSVTPGVSVAPDGKFQTTVQIPGSAPAGTDAVNAYQQGSLVAQTVFMVTPSVPAPTVTSSPPVTEGPSTPPSTGSPGPTTTVPITTTVPSSTTTPTEVTIPATAATRSSVSWGWIAGAALVLAGAVVGGLLMLRSRKRRQADKT
jgi:hypothetical protein